MQTFCLLALVLPLLALPLGAQPRIGAIEIFGAGKVSRDKIQKAIGARPGDPLPKSKGDVEEALEAIDGVVQARLEAFCCDQGKPVLYVGILERGANSFTYRPYPQEEVELPKEILTAYADFSAALSRASAEGDLKEDLTAGHSLMQNLPCRVAQERLIGLAELHFHTIASVLVNAFEPEQRSIAAYVLGYGPDKAAVLKELLLALQDPDASVRANATRATKALAVYAIAHPAENLRVQPTWFVEMLNSVELSDRLEASRVLLLFTEKRDANAIGNIRDRAMPALLEMARWQHLPHALPAYLLAGRVAGWSDDSLESLWASGDREKALKDMEKTLKKR
ncbi:MAG TPA: hypothetical protein VGK29_17420 [Paludibaculum sp.]|jgi:hypothetical protein